MDPAWDRPRGPRPSTASIRVRELSWQGLRNPCPKSKGPGSRRDGCRGQLVEQRLSPARLQALAGVDDLQLVRVLEMSVDTREGSLGNFGVHLPNLDQLKLNGSRLGSLRDLGTSLGRLQVLWLARCGLNDLDGIGSFPALKELYVSYNNISDLSPLCLLEQLEVLDLEGNSVEDLEQVRYLQLCPRLATLTLEGNLVCLRPAPDPSNKVPRDYNYRAEVKKLVPQLQVLDEVPATRPGPPAALTLTQDWLVVKEAIQKGSVLPWLDCLQGAPLQRFNPELSLPETQPRAPRSWSFSLLVPGGPLPQDLLPEDPAQADNASNLTHGAGQVLCGNPTKGLRERRHQCQAWVPPEQLPARRPGDLATSTSTLGPDPADSCDLLDLGRHRARREPGLGHLGSQQEGAPAPRGPGRAPEEQDDQAEPKTPCSPQSPASEPSRTLSFHLTPSPPKCPMPPDSGSSSPWRSADLFRGRQLRALDSLGPGRGEGPGLGRGVAAVTALRALEVASGLSAGAQGCPGPKPAPDPAARPPGLQCRRHLNPMAQSHP
ncbi:leucine-rich repeat-containing protein 56 [Microcebus murinus]|uniref:Leucine rich repeat containing 56 n=1 Tax=Microcebus murinus TaxID=30608 RepID=A0A8B7GP74_MICMU|nr:leucine-rich repeat-containing protein 56 [Microcebus murinus]XP_012624921.1 leucine-rich repeat-containing protein 56 [Microcebus murinus]XP_012624922.1 leucine-rich repeat-containing protein 56 [Microcebus murinus]XP_012624923.1 leucine-rich repeat-containing protein 56 [Microcebus murinus]XP_012624925.1 leucine-rich repeat-containing protein 56 [Microcebus murinus]XP_012624926.1 leucine-rich repeat-containing protein 56 [Microcebus murinus]XP_012624927.1 leucine-rich repeat-containing p